MTGEEQLRAELAEARELYNNACQLAAHWYDQLDEALGALRAIRDGACKLCPPGCPGCDKARAVLERHDGRR